MIQKHVNLFSARLVSGYLTMLQTGSIHLYKVLRDFAKEIDMFMYSFDCNNLHKLILYKHNRVQPNTTNSEHLGMPV